MKYTISGTRTHQILGNIQKGKKLYQTKHCLDGINVWGDGYKSCYVQGKGYKKNSIKTHFLSAGDFFC